MPHTKPIPVKVRPSLGKEVSVLAWIQDAYGNVLMVATIGGQETLVPARR